MIWASCNFYYFGIPGGNSFLPDISIRGNLVSNIDENLDNILTYIKRITFFCCFDIRFLCPRVISIRLANWGVFEL